MNHMCRQRIMATFPIHSLTSHVTLYEVAGGLYIQRNMSSDVHIEALSRGDTRISITAAEMRLPLQTGSVPQAFVVHKHACEHKLVRRCMQRIGCVLACRREQDWQGPTVCVLAAELLCSFRLRGARGNISRIFPLAAATWLQATVHASICWSRSATPYKGRQALLM